LVFFSKILWDEYLSAVPKKEVIRRSKNFRKGLECISSAFFTQNALEKGSQMHFAGLFRSKCTRERISNAFRCSISFKMHSRKGLECISLVYFTQNALEKGSQMHFAGLFRSKCTRERVSNAFRWSNSLKMHSRKDLECIS